MNEDNKNQNLTGDGENEEKVLAEELEALRDTFQEKYDETVEEANEAPVIQELEEGTEEEDEGEEEEENPKHGSEKASKPKKKRSPLKILLITIPVVLVVLFVAGLFSFTMMTVREPKFAEFINHYSNATHSDNYEDKISYYESALALVTDDDSMLARFAGALNLREEAVALTYKENGFAAAYSYMKSNMSEEEIASPKTSEFKKFVSIIDKINEVGLASFSKVFENTGDATEVPAFDVLSNGLDIPKEIETEMGEVLSAISSGYIFNKAAKGIADSLAAVNYYGEAYSALVSVGVDARALAEKIAVALYDNGFVIEAATLISVAIDPSGENVNEEFTRVQQELSVFASYDVELYDIALNAKENEVSDKDGVIALIKESAEISDRDAELFASIVLYTFEAFKAEEEHNLTEAVNCYATITSVLEALGMSDISLTVKTAQVMFDAGNMSEVQSLVDAYLTDEAMAEATEEEKAVRDNINEVFEALTAVNEVFTPYYSSYYQSGTPIDYDALKAELDEKFGADATAYEKGFVDYVLYFAATGSENDIDRMALISSMESYMPELVFLYGYYYLDEYTRISDFSSARSYAEKLLEINVADEFANSIIALCNRVDGDFDAAIEAGLKGIELSGSSANCAKQLAVAYMLKGDFESAFGYVTSMYQNSMSIVSCDLILVFNHLYEGTDETIKTELETLVSEVNQTYSYYQASSYADTTAILDGTKTLEDVFMGGNYDLTDD